MQQPQYYKTVRASERKPPPEVELIFIPEEEAPVFGRFRTVGKTEYVILLDSSGEEEAYFYKDYVHWLEPIPIPDAALLRSALEDVHMRLKDRTDMWNVLATIEQALSKTGDGWIRVEEYDVPMVKHISNSHWITDGKDVYLAYKAGDNWFSKEDKKLPKAFIPTHIKPHTKPSPPQPINP